MLWILNLIQNLQHDNLQNLYLHPPSKLKIYNMTVLIPIILQLCYLGKSSDSAYVLFESISKENWHFLHGVLQNILQEVKGRMHYRRNDYSSWRRFDSDTWDVSLLPWNQWWMRSWLSFMKSGKLGISLPPLCVNLDGKLKPQRQILVLPAEN